MSIAPVQGPPVPQQNGMSPSCELVVTVLGMTCLSAGFFMMVLDPFRRRFFASVH